MIQKIIFIKNVGRFRNSQASPTPTFKKLNYIFGANAFGKSTACAVFRSYGDGATDELIGRKSLGSTDDQRIAILTDGATHTFSASSWSHRNPNIAVFDETFVSTNVHSGSVVDSDNKRALYRVMVGDKGVELAQEETELVELAKTLQADIRQTKQLISTYAKSLDVDTFASLPTIEDIDLITLQQKKAVERLTASKEIKEHDLLTSLNAISIDGALFELLNTTVDGLSQEAVKNVTKHLAEHSMQLEGEHWIKQGLKFAQDDTCPFCSRPELNAQPLFKYFTDYFSESYSNLLMKVEKINPMYVAPQLGSSARQVYARTQEQNGRELRFWATHIENLPELSDLMELMQKVREIENFILLAAEKKRNSIETTAADCEWRRELAKKVSSANGLVEKINLDVRLINDQILRVKKSIETDNLEAEVEKLNALIVSQKRQEKEVSDLCKKYKDLVDKKNKVDDDKKSVRSRIDSYTNTVISTYEDAINRLLEKFNAGFQISKTAHSYIGGSATSSYQLRIDNYDVAIGDHKTPLSQPSFKNTLSSGDKATLALAFFLAKLHEDSKLSERIVIFDDPFNSQDAFRRTQTAFEILDLGAKCEQIFVLSHDINFLRQLWTRSAASERIAAQIDYHRSTGSKLRELDLEAASQGRTTKELDDLLAFRMQGTGNLRDVIKKMRIVCESHCRRTYPGYFTSEDTLGAILGKIRADTSHPAFDKYDDLHSINDYSQTYHHGEDAKGQFEPHLDKSELDGFVNRALRLVNAIAE